MPFWHTTVFLGVAAIQILYKTYIYIHTHMHLRLQTEVHKMIQNFKAISYNLLLNHCMEVAYLQMSWSKPMISSMDLRSYFDRYLRPFPPNLLWEHPHDSTSPSHNTFSSLSSLTAKHPLSSLWSTHQIRLQLFFHHTSQQRSLSPISLYFRSSLLNLPHPAVVTQQAVPTNSTN
jgi:hypothetical protein